MKRNIVWMSMLIVVAIVAFLLGKGTALAPQAEEKAPLAKLAKPFFAGAEKHEITKEEAVQLIANHQKALTAKPSKLKAAPALKGGSFDRAVVDKILSQPGCQRLMFYYATEQTGKETFVLVGVDTSGKDMTTGCIAERTMDCPPFCLASELVK